MKITDLDGDPTRPGRRARGLSMDIIDSPYLLPAGLQGSDGSIHSMSRTVQDEHDPYRPVAFIRGSTDNTRRPFKENGSMYSASTAQTSSHSNDDVNLLQNAQRMSQSFQKRGESMATSDSKPSEDLQLRLLHSNRSVPTSRKTSLSSETALSNITERKEALPPIPSISLIDRSLPPPPEPPVEQSRPPRTSSSSASRPPRKDSRAAPPKPIDTRHMSDASFYGDDAPPPPPPKAVEPEERDYDVDPNDVHTGRFSIDTPMPSQQFPVQNNRVSVMGQRPLPPDDPAENAEQRANRIRSFYKEYFDDRRPNPAYGYYEEDLDADYLDATLYDPETGNFMSPQAPYAQPMGRRAMTPPPRAVGGPRFAAEGHDRHYSTMSAGRAQPRGRPGQRAPIPKKKLPPPKELNSLPTPHLLREDTALIMNPIDFAPPTSFRELQNGRRPDSPKGILRPYSPSVKAYSPLTPAFHELNVMPSPHQLRKSGAFTSLDFAPPRFRSQDGGASDAGSIRSARSGISAVQMDAVRAGAYRVSRIPKEMVTTKQDLATQLRPKWDLSNPV